VTAAAGPLRPGLDLARLLDDVVAVGAAHAPDALTEPFLAALQAEVATLAFTAVEPVVGGRVWQEAGACVVGEHDLGEHPALAGLRVHLVRGLHHHAARVPGLTQWFPNEVCAQRYEPGTVGVTPHLDHKRYAGLVAIVTVTGAADFTLCRDRAGDPIETWNAGAGSLVLLRGPGLGGVADGRPLHMVAGPMNGHRVSVGIRMDTRQTNDT
jgi:hypothetical protein